ncbi:MAG: hypothetical protein K2O89_01165 [Clostridia bacterium]|nr:hypothetical protein [Clostridia bacterium]
MANSKIDTYIGFCIKSGKISIGSGAIATLKGGVKLLVLDGTAAKNSKRLALKFKNRFNCPLIICKSGFERVVNREGAKIAAIRDEELSKAILQNSDDNYELYTEGSI